MMIQLDCNAGSRFIHADTAGAHTVHATQIKYLRRLIFSVQVLLRSVCVPSVRLPDSKVHMAEPGQLGIGCAGKTLFTGTAWTC